MCYFFLNWVAECDYKSDCCSTIPHQSIQSVTLIFLFFADSMDRSTLDNSMANSVLSGGIPTDIKPDLITLASAASQQQQQPTGFSPSSTQPGYSPSNSNNSGSGYSPSSSTGQPQQNYFNMMPNSTTHMPAGAGGAPVGGIHSPTMHSPSSSTLSPTSTMGSGYGQAGMANKHNCSICGDRASGKHYGVHR